MSLTHDMLSNSSSLINEYSLINKGVLLLDEMFLKNGWHNIKNEFNHIVYTRTGYETEYFEIKVDMTKVYVSIPIKNITYQYTTSFDNYFLASEYVESRFKDFMN